MEFVNETDYDWRALRALNRAAIRLDRRWRSLLLRAMGVLCGLILLRGAWTSGGVAGGAVRDEGRRPAHRPVHR